ncbi:hypothetical protein Y032_0522g2904 [Ancylostoma ceylanicum]|uniref:Mos1 transposase HTH domain-containing protein n=1 Tax=Ancylostoma ceylanicum TaxID=53326 RepID=A0A016WTV1_9BILA|nr:hypothetical protein Y032_0522g2904 [Ancylostoma ceylanicum]
MNSVEEAADATRNIIMVFGKGAASERTVCRWFKKFRSGDFNLENEPRGRPEVKVDNEELTAVVEADTPQTPRELAVRFGVSKQTMLDHLNRIGKVKKLDRWVPHDLSEDQKETVSTLVFPCCHDISSGRFAPNYYL